MAGVAGDEEAVIDVTVFALIEFDLPSPSSCCRGFEGLSGRN